MSCHIITFSSYVLLLVMFPHISVFLNSWGLAHQLWMKKKKEAGSDPCPLSCSHPKRKIALIQPKE